MISNYYVTGTAVVLLLIAGGFLLFERRRPQARELTVLAVMSAAAVVSRAAFAFIPNFKPMTAIVMLTGIAFGPEAGFLTGAVSALVSNFLFGQGPWTPWQMFAIGFGGWLAGLCIPRIVPARKIPMAIFGGAAVLLIVGPVLDTSTLFMGMTALNGASGAGQAAADGVTSILRGGAVAAVYVSGLPVNAIHAAATVLTLFFLGEPVLERLERMKRKYGLMEER